MPAADDDTRRPRKGSVNYYLNAAEAITLLGAMMQETPNIQVVNFSGDAKLLVVCACFTHKILTFIAGNYWCLKELMQNLSSFPNLQELHLRCTT